MRSVDFDPQSASTTAFRLNKHIFREAFIQLSKFSGHPHWTDISRACQNRNIFGDCALPYF